TLIKPFDGDPTVADTGLTTLTADVKANAFVRASGSFLEEGFEVGEQVKASGFAANDGTYVITELTDTVMTVDRPLDERDVGGRGSERLTGTQGTRGILLNSVFALRARVQQQAEQAGPRPAEDFNTLLRQVASDLTASQTVSQQTLQTLYRS